MSISTDVVALSKERILAMKPLKSFCHNVKVSSLEYSSDGLRLLAVTSDNHMRLFDLRDGSSSRIIPMEKYGITQAIFGPHPETVLHTCNKMDNNVRYMSMHDNKYIRIFSGHQDKVTNIEFNPLKDSFMSCSLDNTLKIWDVRTNKISYELRVENVPVGAHDPEGVVIGVGIGSKIIKLYDIRNLGGGPFQTFEIQEIADTHWSHMKFSKSGANIIISTNNNSFIILDSFNADYVHMFRSHQNLNKEDLFGDVTADELFAFYGGSDANVHLFDTKTVQQVGVMKSTHKGLISHILFNPYYALMATGGNDGIRLWC